MLKALSLTKHLSKSSISRSLPAFSTCNVNLSVDPTARREAPILDNKSTLMLPDEAKEKKVLESEILVPTKVDLSPVSGIPDEHVKTRRVRIYQPAKNAMQSGTNNIQHWEMEFDTRKRWENPLMGWTSTGDPLSNMKVQFSSPDDAIEHCEKHGWAWYLDVPKLEREFKPKNYGINFSWNRRTRVSTK